MSDDAPIVPPKAPPPPELPYIVGLGASAGGLEALETFFDHMPSDSGLSFVVVQHLSPDFKSLMDELLARHTTMPVHRVEDGMRVEPNAIYLIPPKKEMIISEGRLLLKDKDVSTALALPIDIFFRSLATDARGRAIAVVLSGTGSDGSRGVREVDEAGGLVLAQLPESAAFDGMPKSAIDTGIVDACLPPAQMPDAILNYVRHGSRIASTSNASLTGSETGIERIVQLLRSEYGIDFSHYKPNTLKRRIQRRLLLNGSLDLEEYVTELSHDLGELHKLYKDLLIGVTRFFRDRDAFTRLESEVIPQLLDRVPPDDEMRIWIPGCATGEEAYSLAILLLEQLEARHRTPNVKIFATDVHRASLEHASSGVYGADALSDVGALRLNRYFQRQNGRYQVVPELRKLIVFAPHNVIKDAPFTRLDLISCRNLLIYFEPLTQKKVLALFHFALKPNGILFLGPSESPGELSNEFDCFDRQWKVYRKKRDIHLLPDLRMPLASGIRPVRAPLRAQRSQEELAAAEAEIIRTFAPPIILVDPSYQVVHTYNGAGRYLTQPSEGRTSLNVLDMVDAELKLTLTGALGRALKTGEPISYSGVRSRSAGDAQKLHLSVRPVLQTGETWFVVALEPDPQAAVHVSEETADLSQFSNERITSLEGELQHTRENLQATLEEMETANEELQAANEELVASNEELQSTNEELHSVNEELYTVNTEHQQKIRELTELTEDMDNLLTATAVGIIFLDKELKVRKFTPRIAETFHLVERDVGRRIDTFAHTLNFPDLIERLRQVVSSGEAFEQEVSDAAEHSYLVRLVPYVTGSSVEGVVVNLIDVTRLKQAEHKLALMSKVFMDGADPIIIEDLDGKITDVNAEAVRAYGFSPDELLGQSTDQLVPETERERYRELRARCRELEHVRNAETLRRRKDGTVHPVLLTLSLLSDGRSTYLASIAKDITQRVESERQVQQAVLRRDQFLAMLSHELRNPLAAALNATELFSRPESDDGMQIRAASAIRRQITQMARLLDDLLDVSRVMQGKITLRLRPLDLKETIDAALEVMRPMVAQRQQTLQVDLEDAPLIVNGDPSRLRQIQENLLSNASKYTPRGGHIWLSAKREDDAAVVRIRDSGRGIPTEMLESIFEMFTQVEDPIDRSEGGMGLGLTLVRKLTELHGGEVVAHSDGMGRGSELRVRFPLTAERITAAQPSVQVSARKLRIVVIEDNPDSREMLSEVLKLEGHDVRVAADGEAGIKEILKDPPDVALVDIGLPRLDGFGVAARIRQAIPNANVRLIALTGYGRDEDRRSVLNAGFNLHLVKPVRHEELRVALHSPDEPSRAARPSSGVDRAS